MSVFHRLFAAGDAVAPMADVEAALLAVRPDVRVAWSAEGGEWFRAEVRTAKGSPVVLERWTADEEGIRAELNAWAAYLETLDYSPNAAPLMERVVTSRQLVTIRLPIAHPDDALVGRLCDAVAACVLGTAGGFRQIDGRGFFDADGGVIVEEY